jgi:hypothetical protein
MYLDDIAAVIRTHIPEGRMPKGDAEDLLLIYAVLARAKGVGVTQSDVHDAWSVWMLGRNNQHESLVEYEKLAEDVREEDAVFATAIRRAAKQLGFSEPSRPLFANILFPSGPPEEPADTQQVLDLYKIMVQSSEGLVGRRQAVNTFFLTINGALLTGYGLIIQNSGGNKVGALGIAVLAVAGTILCAAWRSLIISFGQLNRGKFQVINTIERYLKVAIYAAEWEALGRGEDPKVYRSFTSREIWVPDALLVLHIVIAVIALAVYSQWFSLR